MHTRLTRASGRLAALAVAGVAAGGMLSLATSASALAAPVSVTHSAGSAHTVSVLRAGHPGQQHGGFPGQGGGFSAQGGFITIGGFSAQGGYGGGDHGGYGGHEGGGCGDDCSGHEGGGWGGGYGGHEGGGYGDYDHHRCHHHPVPYRPL